MSGPLLVDVGGPALDAADLERLSHPLVGQVILFTRNFASCDQLEALCAEIHALRDPPLLIVADHEGGRVQRFRAGFTSVPPMADFGCLWRTDAAEACRLARATGVVVAHELRAHGIDMALAPVLDLDWGRSRVIGERSFGRDPWAVAQLAGALAQGYATAGMSCCGKHFPGHGWAEGDSHVAVPCDDRPLEELLREDMAPYRWLGPALGAVMPAHVVYPAVDSMPAGFSRVWLQDVLRARVGFQGAVISDDLSMQGAEVAGPVEQRAARALQAGCDIVTICNDPAAVDRVLRTLRWESTPEFVSRRARLRPRGDAVFRGDLSRDAVWRAAARDLAAWIDRAPPADRGGGDR
ncbi:MAG TPA: beta-N-acetylhexosaminidase [Burkholderiaceae bacterium]|nr:beta-N-acetylhexosaminidase [Burkholderiaceae bacterium]